MSIVSARQSGGSALVVDVVEKTPLVINLDRHEFAWEGFTGGFPVRVSVQRVHLLALPIDPTYVAYDLDRLLWEAGLVAFAEQSAGWLDPDSRVRLSGWPNLTVLDHSPEQVRMIAALGAEFLTAAELAAATDVELGDAQRLINALGLMELLRSSPIAVTATPNAPRAQVQRGLFRRLRDRLGI
jgi:hypothetical protein